MKTWHQLLHRTPASSSLIYMYSPTYSWSVEYPSTHLSHLSLSDLCVWVCVSLYVPVSLFFVSLPASQSFCLYFSIPLSLSPVSASPALYLSARLSLFLCLSLSIYLYHSCSMSLYLSISVSICTSPTLCLPALLFYIPLSMSHCLCLSLSLYLYLSCSLSLPLSLCLCLSVSVLLSLSLCLYPSVSVPMSLCQNVCLYLFFHFSFVCVSWSSQWIVSRAPVVASRACDHACAVSHVFAQTKTWASRNLGHLHESGSTQLKRKGFIKDTMHEFLSVWTTATFSISGLWPLVHRNHKLEISKAPTKAKSREPYYSKAQRFSVGFWLLALRIRSTNQ